MATSLNAINEYPIDWYTEDAGQLALPLHLYPSQPTSKERGDDNV